MADTEGFRPLTEEELREFCKQGRYFPNFLDKRDVDIKRGSEDKTQTGESVPAQSADGTAEREFETTAGEINPTKVFNDVWLLFRGLYNVKAAVCTILNAPGIVTAVWGFDMASLTTSVGDTNGPPPAIAIFREGYVAFPKEINAALWIAPVGADILIDVNHHDATTGTKTSLFDTEQLTVPDGATTGRLKTFRPIRVKRYDLLSIDVDQVGSSTPGGYLEVAMELEIKKLITAR